MGFDDFSFLHIDKSVIDEINERNKALFDDLPSFPEILAEQIKPIIEGNQNVVNGLKDNYKKLEELYELKEKELTASQEEARRAKKYNIAMLIIALVSAGIALASLVATILIAIYSNP